MPITLEGYFVEFAISVIEIEEVLEARIASFLQSSDRSLNIFNFKSLFSVAASTIRSALSTDFFRFVLILIFASVSSLSSSDIFSFSTILVKFFSITFIALSSES